MYDILIIGGGPAGLTAAIYARRAAKSVLLLEGKSVGGQIVNAASIENYPAEAHISGFDFSMRLYEQAVSLGAKIVFERALEIGRAEGGFSVHTKRDDYDCRALILATGCENRKLGLENEDRFLGRGISYCATCDGNFYKGKTVAVVGGGNTAVEDALYLSAIAEKIFLIHRRDAFRADGSAVSRLLERENVEPVLNSRVIALKGDQRLEGVCVENRAGETRVLDVSCLFVAIGQEPSGELLSPFCDLDAGGYAACAEDCHTKTPGVFVAGDIRSKRLRQLVTAASDGACAAAEAVRFINERYS